MSNALCFADSFPAISAASSERLPKTDRMSNFFSIPPILSQKNPVYRLFSCPCSQKIPNYIELYYNAKHMRSVLDIILHPDLKKNIHKVYLVLCLQKPDIFKCCLTFWGWFILL